MSGLRIASAAAALLALGLAWTSGYHAGKVAARPADMLCLADDGEGNAAVDLYGPDGELLTTARIDQQERIAVLFERAPR